MRKITVIIRYFIIFLFAMLAMMMINILLLFKVSNDTKNELAFVQTQDISDCLTGDGKTGFTLEEDGVNSLKKYNAFAMLIDGKGDVVWEYKLPNEFSRHYTIQEVAIFSKWYLDDYPVYVHTRDDGILVVGLPKNTVWKYIMIFSEETIRKLAGYLPSLFVINLFVIIMVPLILTKRQSRRREMERTTWIAGISHDIRTPLAIALGHAEVIKNSDINQNIADRAVKIEQEIINIRTRVMNLNTENKLTYGMGKWKKENLQLSAILREILCDIINNEPGDRYGFDTDIDENAEGLYVYGDKELIKRMIENLIYNSIKHNPKGCDISVKLREYKKYMLVKSYCLEISDNGCGVTKQQIKAFAKSLDVKNTTRLPEHGLGIRLVKQIAKLHHWKVKFNQNENEGLKCRVIITVKCLKNIKKDEKM